MRPLFTMRPWLVLALLLTLGIARPASAMTNAAWVKSVYSAVLLRAPTAAELVNAVAALDGGQTRFQVAFSLLTSTEAFEIVVGADPFRPGYIQLLLARNATAPEVAYVNCLRLQNSQDEMVIALLIGGQSNVNACQPPGQTSVEYEARAMANNPGLAACIRQEAVIDQIYQDLLGRHATVAELQATVAATLSSILDPLSSASAADEYRSKFVRGAFLRFLHRLPNTTESVSYQDVLTNEQVLGNFGDESLEALLLASPEYGGGGGTILDGFVLSNLPPILAGPLLVALNQSVLNLSNQVLSNEETIEALTLADFGAKVTAAAASAELDLASLKVAQVRVILQRECPPDVRCELIDSRQLQLAESALLGGYEELSRGESPAAARDAQRAYEHAILALPVNAGRR